MTSPSQRVRDIVQVAILGMTAVLFSVWFVFGNATITKQNTSILTGIEVQLRQAEARLDRVIELNAVGDRTIVCILRIDPDKRNNHNTHRCLLAAERGQDHLGR